MIRPLRFKDIGAVKEVYKVAFDEEYRQRGVDIVKKISRWQQLYPLIKLLTLFPNPYQQLFNVHVFETDEAPKKIIGIIQTSAGNREQTRWHIDNIAVMPGYRGQGVAKKLLEYIFETYGSRGILTFTLEVDAHNAAALKLYESVGFHRYMTVCYHSLAPEALAQVTPEDGTPDFLRPYKKTDVNALYDLYNAATPEHVRIVHKRRAADFKFRLFDLITDNLKRYTIRCDRKFYVVPEGDRIVASVEIIAQYKDLPHVVRLMVHPAHEYLYGRLLDFALGRLARQPQHLTLISVTDYQQAKQQAVEDHGFKLLTRDHMLVRDNLIVMKLPKASLGALVKDDAFRPAFTEFHAGRMN